VRQIAKWLRKLADLFDPRVKPTGSDIVIRLSCDASDFVAGIREATEAAKRFQEFAERAKVSAEAMPKTGL
jgi:hypothetical protein